MSVLAWEEEGKKSVVMNYNHASLIFVLTFTLIAALILPIVTRLLLPAEQLVPHPMPTGQLQPQRGGGKRG